MSDESEGFQEFETQGWDEVASGYATSSVVAGLTGQAATEMIRSVGAAGGRRILDVAGASVAGVEFRQARAEHLRFSASEFDVPLPDGPDMFRFANPDEARATLADIGFTDVAVEELALEAPLGDASQAMDLVSRATVRTRALFAAQTEEAQAAITAAVTEAVAEMQEDGSTSVPMPGVLISATRP